MCESDSPKQQRSDEGGDADIAWMQQHLQDAPAWTDPSEGQVLTEVLEAAEDGDARRLTDALRRLNVSVDTAGEDGDTALQLACLYGHESCVAALLEHGASARCRDGDGGTPLLDAAASGDLAIVRRLHMAAPELINAADVDGDTPLHNAARGGFADIVSFLLENGADARARNNAGRLPADEVDRSDDAALYGTLQHAASADQTA